MRAEEKLRESEEGYHALLHLEAEVGESVIMLQNTEQGEAIQTFVSEQWPHITGYSEDELLGMSYFNLVSTKDRAACIERHRRKMNGETLSGLYEMNIIRKDGKEVPVELTSAKTTFKKKKANVAFIRDITQRKQLEKELMESENIYRTIFETTGTAMNITEDSGMVSLVNKEWENAYGYSKEELEGKMKYTALVHESDLTRVIDIFKSRSLDPYSAPRTYETRIVDKKGVVKDILATVAMIPGTSKRVVSVADITDLKQTEKKLRQSEKRLRLLSRRVINVQEEERTRIARELHDELGQELTALQIEVISLAEKFKKNSLVKRLEILVDLTDRIIQTTHNISVNLRPEMLDKLGLVKAIQWYAENFERQTGISCPIIAEDQVIVSSKEIETSAYRIIQEALTNVLKHAKATEVAISLSKNRNKLIIHVLDNGVGMDMSNHVDESSLGLLGMRERANILGGELRIKSQSGKGTEIIAYLPLLEANRSSEE